MNLLDTSFCNSKVRNYVLDLYRSPLLSVKRAYNEISDHTVRYISLRGLKLNELVVDSALFQYILENNIDDNNIDTSKVTSIFESFNCTTDAAHWTQLINSCPRLTILELRDDWWLSETVLQQIDIRILQQLKVFKIAELYTDANMNLLAPVCYNLVECDLRLTEEHAKMLFKNNRNLENVSIRCACGLFSHDLIADITVKCQSIKTLSIENCGKGIVLSDFTSINNQNKLHMTKLYFCFDDSHFTFSTQNNVQKLEIRERNTTISPASMLTDCFKSFNKVTEYELNGITQLTDSALFAISENKNTNKLIISRGTLFTVKGLTEIVKNCSRLFCLDFWFIDHISKEDLVSLFQIKNKLINVYLFGHTTLNSESVISILESTFKYRPDESQNGLIKEKIQKLIIGGCSNVGNSAIQTYLRDNKDCFVVKYNGNQLCAHKVKLLIVRCVHMCVTSCVCVCQCDCHRILVISYFHDTQWQVGGARGP